MKEKEFWKNFEASKYNEEIQNLEKLKHPSNDSEKYIKITKCTELLNKYKKINIKLKEIAKQLNSKDLKKKEINNYNKEKSALIEEITFLQRDFSDLSYQLHKIDEEANNIECSPDILKQFKYINPNYQDNPYS